MGKLDAAKILIQQPLEKAIQSIKGYILVMKRMERIMLQWRQVFVQAKERKGLPQ